MSELLHRIRLSIGFILETAVDSYLLSHGLTRLGGSDRLSTTPPFVIWFLSNVHTFACEKVSRGTFFSHLVDTPHI